MLLKHFNYTEVQKGKREVQQ